MLNHLKLFEDFGEDAYFYPGIVLNLKERTNGNLYISNPIYAVSNFDYEIGKNPPLIQLIPREKRTPKDNELLKLQGYFESEFNKLLKRTYNNRRSSKLNKLIDYLKDLGYEFKTKEHKTGHYLDNQIENTLFFETKYEVDEFLKDLRKYVDMVTMVRFTEEDPFGEEDWDE